MGVVENLRRLAGRGAPRLAREKEEPARHEVDKLEISTAEELVIVTVDSAGARLLAEVARSGAPARLSAGNVTAAFVPTARDELPVRDPRRGWVIALPAQTRQAMTRLLRPGAGEVVVSQRLAFAVE